MAASAVWKALSAACSISAAVCTRTHSTPRGTWSDVGPSTSVTAAPRRAASPARAMPILPDEQLPMKRTGSIGSCVGPAVITMRLPTRS